MNNYTITQPYPFLYRILDPLNVYMTLIVGDEKAILFDTGYGTGDIHAALKSVTDKPVTVILGHGHIDHVNGAYQFNKAYLHENDFDLFREHTSAEMRKGIYTDAEKKGLAPNITENEWNNAAQCELLKLEHGTVFDLGGLRVQVVDMSGHTAGTVGLLITEHRVLLESDGANGHVWMFLPQSLPVSEYIKMLERVSAFGFDTFHTAHSDKLFPKSDYGRFISAAKNAEISKATLYDMFMDLNPYIYTEDGVSIVFNERTLS